MILEHINSPKDVKGLNDRELVLLSDEIREALLKSVSKFGGHLGPNLGVVELTIALHYVFDSPKDKIVFDVSHQCYAHKMLTGRKEAYLDDDKHGLYSGFSNPSESEHDVFEIGHTSTAISLANGLARARDLLGEKENVIVLIGDGSLSGGEAYEGLNNVAETKTNTIVIVNDNENSIGENHGGYAFNLEKLRTSKGKTEDNLFKALGFDYIYVEEGNDVLKLIEIFKSIKDIDHPIVVHVHTLKGKGYQPAIDNPEKFHSLPPFDLKTGEVLKEQGGESYAEMTMSYIEKKVAEGEPIVAINAGTSGFVFAAKKERREKLGEHFIDVGICEEHAAAMASGMARRGAKAIWAVASSFMQRTYDQIMQDIALNNSPVTILDEYGGGLSGQGAPTHSGIYDIAMLMSIPNLIYLAPIFKEEYMAMLDYAVNQNKHSVCIHVPTKIISSGKEDKTDYSILNKSKFVKEGKDVAIIAVGITYERAVMLDEELGGCCSIINPVFLSGLDTELLDSLHKNHKIVVTLEDGVIEGGFGQKITAYFGPSEMKTLTFGIPKEFHRNKNASQMEKEAHMSIKEMSDSIKRLLK